MRNICYNCFRDSLDEAGICTLCGFGGVRNREKFPQALPLGSILFGRYIVGRVLGQGGFGITYLAQDYQTKGLVAIKEFFPDTMASRTARTTVTPYPGERGENFKYGLNGFLDEAKTMAEFIGNPNITRVDCYFEENGTGYFVMEYLEGDSFLNYIEARGGKISWDETMQVIFPVMNSLEAMHEKGIIHRDVTPDNIYITKDGTVKLLDFGAARYSLGNVSRSLDVILKHGFAPKEQYSRHGRQGPYTDVYALGATLYYAITGTKPDDAIERSDEDNLPMPTTLGARITIAQEDALLKAMAIQPGDRYQNIPQFRSALLAAQPKPEPPKPPEPEPPKPELLKPEPPKPEPPKPQKEEPEQPDTTGQKETPKVVTVKEKTKKPLPKWLIPAVAVVLIVAGIGIWAKMIGNISYIYETNDTGVTITGFEGEYPSEVVLPRKINGKPVTSIGDSAFSGCTSLTSISIPDSVISIGRGAFDHCTSLTNISIPDGVTSIGESTFRDCASLTSVTIPDSVTSIERGTFTSCKSLTSVSIPDSVTFIGEEAFRDCTSLTTVTIPYSVTSIERLAFAKCTSLSNLTIPDSVTSIAESAFASCTSLTAVFVPHSVTFIGAAAFLNCERLTTVTISDGVTHIGNSVFSHCTRLTTVTIPNSVTSIGSYAFNDCTSLTSISIPDSVTSIGDSAFHGCTSLKSVTIPDSVTSIGKLAFRDCISLTSVSIPDSVISIGSSAFSYCASLKSVSIPSNCELGEYAFPSGCTVTRR